MRIDNFCFSCVKFFTSSLINLSFYGDILRFNNSYLLSKFDIISNNKFIEELLQLKNKYIFQLRDTYHTILNIRAHEKRIFKPIILAETPFGQEKIAICKSIKNEKKRERLTLC